MDASSQSFPAFCAGKAALQQLSLPRRAPPSMIYINARLACTTCVRPAGSLLPKHIPDKPSARMFVPLITEPMFWIAVIPAMIFLGLAKAGFFGVDITAPPPLALYLPPLESAALREVLERPNSHARFRVDAHSPFQLHRSNVAATGTPALCIVSVTDLLLSG